MTAPQHRLPVACLSGPVAGRFALLRLRRAYSAAAACGSATGHPLVGASGRWPGRPAGTRPAATARAAACTRVLPAWFRPSVSPSLRGWARPAPRFTSESVSCRTTPRTSGGNSRNRRGADTPYLSLHVGAVLLHSVGGDPYGDGCSRSGRAAARPSQWGSNRFFRIFYEKSVRPSIPIISCVETKGAVTG